MVRTEVFDAFQAVFGRYDLLVGPTSPAAGGERERRQHHRAERVEGVAVDR